jgi:hypothetical protein
MPIMLLVLYGILGAMLLGPIFLWVLGPEILTTCKVFNGLSMGTSPDVQACILREGWPVLAMFFVTLVLVRVVVSLFRQKRGKRMRNAKSLCLWMLVFVDWMILYAVLGGEGTAGATASVIPIAATVNIIVLAVQAAGGGFIALKALWLGISWRRGHEHGMDEFSALGIAAALIVGATAIGSAVGGSAGSALAALPTLHTLSADVGDFLGASLYSGAAVVPGLRLYAWLRGR